MFALNHEIPTILSKRTVKKVVQKSSKRTKKREISIKKNKLVDWLIKNIIKTSKNVFHDLTKKNKNIYTKKTTQK